MTKSAAYSRSLNLDLGDIEPGDQLDMSTRDPYWQTVDRVISDGFCSREDEDDSDHCDDDDCAGVVKLVVAEYADLEYWHIPWSERYSLKVRVVCR